MPHTLNNFFLLSMSILLNAMEKTTKKFSFRATKKINWGFRILKFHSFLSFECQKICISNQINERNEWGEKNWNIYLCGKCKNAFLLSILLPLLQSHSRPDIMQSHNQSLHTVWYSQSFFFSGNNWLGNEWEIFIDNLWWTFYSTLLLLLSLQLNNNNETTWKTKKFMFSCKTKQSLQHLLTLVNKNQLNLNLKIYTQSRGKCNKSKTVKD